MRERLIIPRKRAHRKAAGRSSTPVRAGHLLRATRTGRPSGQTPLTHQPPEAGRPLDATTRSAMKTRLGHDFSRVRVHTGPEAAASADALQANAYTRGRDIFFGAGRYEPATAEGRRLLAHELTHVVQQTAVPGAAASPVAAEKEADQNSRRPADSSPRPIVASMPTGAIQREEKPKVGASGERTGTKEGKDKFSFKADITIPITSDLKLGPVSFLNDLKLTGTGGFTGEPLGLTPADPDTLKLQLAITLAKLELANVKDKEEALRKGKVSFGTTLSATGGPTFTFNPYDPSGSLGTSLTTSFSATTPSLIPSRIGTLTLGASASGTGSVTQTLGPEATRTPKAEAKGGVSADFKSAPISGLGGTSLTAGLTGSASSAFTPETTGLGGKVTPEKTSSKLGVGASVGFSGKTGDAKHFFKIQVNGDINIDQEAGNATTTTKSIFVGATTGFEF